MFRIVALVFAVAQATIAFAQVEKPVPGLKAQQDEYATALSKAKLAYDEAAKKAAEQYREKLTAMQGERTKAGDLEGAVKIRDLLTESKKEATDTAVSSPGKPKEILAREKMAAALSKVTWVPGPGGWADKFVCGSDGFMYMPPVKKLAHTWSVLDSKTVVVISPTSVVDVFEIDLVKGTIKGRALGSAQNSKAEWEATKAK